MTARKPQKMVFFEEHDGLHYNDDNCIGHKLIELLVRWEIQKSKSFEWIENNMLPGRELKFL
jgi:hypothetical protein